MSKVKENARLKSFLIQDIACLQDNIQELEDFRGHTGLISELDEIKQRLDSIEMLLYHLKIIPMSDNVKAIIYGEEVSN
jgi:uncharacterized protein YerC